MDEPTILIAVALILSGAVVMLLNVTRFRKTISVFDRFDLAQQKRLKLLGQLHRGLMFFFLVGYVAVAYALLSDVDLVSEIFVGLIFAMGAVFVWLGIILQDQMIDLIQSRYQQASEAKTDLELERERLESTNDQLIAEIGERRRVESALRESEQRLKFILDQIPSGILIVDASSMIITSANPAAMKLLGLTKMEVIGSPYGEVVGAVRGDIWPEGDPGLRTGRFKRKVIEARGQEIPILTKYCRIRLEGRPHLLESLIDISDKERLEIELQRAQKMEALGTLAGGVAHDLNNILSGIVSYPDLLLKDLPPGSPMRRPIQTIQKSGKKAAAIVQDMLALARRGVVVKEVVNLADVVRDYLLSPEHGRLKAYHPDVTFNFKESDGILNIKGSAVHLIKTVMNLASNAAEAMPEGGDVLVKLENRYVDCPLTGYDTVEEGDYVMLSVSDTGVGIAQEDQDRIFEPFFTKKEMGRSGTGLGMAVDDSFEAYRGNGQTILIVDDVSEQRDIAMDMLTVLNCRPHAVSSGEEAVAYLRRHSIDLILLDMIMEPGIGGLQTFQEVLKVHPDQRAVLVSGFAKTDDVRVAQKLGAGGYLRKPYSLLGLAKVVIAELAVEAPPVRRSQA